MIKTITWINSKYFWSDLEYFRFAIMAISIMGQTALGSIAVYYSLVNETYILLPIVMTSNVAANTVVIAPTPIKWMIYLIINSLIISTMSIILSFIL